MITTVQEVALHPTSSLHLPPAQLSGCIFAAIIRDTRRVRLSDADRLNHFPASPLVSATCVIEGEVRLVPREGGLEAARLAPPMPRLTVTPPQDVPITSWSSGPVFAVSVGFYPDAWAKIASAQADRAVPGVLSDAFQAFENGDNSEESWARFCEILGPFWRSARNTGGLPDWSGAPRLTDWSRALLGRAALAGPGRSIRALERRIRRWSGQTRQSLAFYAELENLHQLSTKSSETPLTALAYDAGYADQSHMGRAVRRATGFSPAHLNRRIESEEAFWCYRLLGERF
jgi:AraC-like DNA-binding protein